MIEGENELRLTCSRSASGGIVLLRCETQDDIVRLPDEIDGVPVTEVGAYVLSERAPDLTGKDTFAVRITCGGTESKHNAAAIRTVTLPKDAKSVGSYAFYNCRSLERIELTGSVSEFGGGALMNCMSLRGCCSPSTSRNWRISVRRIFFSGAFTVQDTATVSALTAVC